MIHFRLVPDGSVYDVEVLDAELKAFGRFVNLDLFGRSGVERQLEIARAVRAGTWSEDRGGVRRPVATYECGHNAFEVTITPTTTTVEREESGERSVASTDDYIRFLEELLAATDVDA